MGSNTRTLLKAVTAGRSRQVRLLLDLGASIEESDDCGQTPLIRAIFLEADRIRDKIMRMLLKRGAKVSHGDVVGRTALSWACLYGHDNDVTLLLEYADVDLDLNKCDINGQTALFHSVTSGNTATVKLIAHALRKYDMSVDVPDNNGNSPLMHANRLGHDVCASILITDGCAKVGNNKGSHSNSRKEKWAVSSYRDRARRNKRTTNQSSFPPVSTTKANKYNVNKLLQDRASRHFNNLDSEQGTGSSSEEELQSMMFYKAPITGKFNNNVDADLKTWSHTDTPVRNCLRNFPRCGIPPSILASPTSSTIVNQSGDSDSEVDSVASTIVEKLDNRRRERQTHLDLNSMYDSIQDQMCSSYRPTAVPQPEPEQPTTPVEVSQGTEKAANAFLKGKSRKDVEAHKWMHLKKNLRLTGAGSQKSTDTLVSDKKTALPQISDRRVHLVQNWSRLISKLATEKLETEQKNNYMYATKI